jgi:Zn-dependent M28 family amino/carboxypeptidase
MFTSKHRSFWKFAGALALVFAACSTAAIGEISAERLRERTVRLASDDFEGRGPGTEGERKTVEYLAAQYKAAGLAPGNPNGTFFQDVPLVGITTQVQPTFQAGAETLSPTPLTEFSAVSRRVTPKVEVKDNEIVFVGYGVIAPEYNWDDYKGLDVRGKTVVMLINDPPVVAQNDPSKLDDTVFRGRAMTYYGRWTYKYDIAAQLGAAACLIVHETGPAGYPFAVVGSTHGREHFDLKTPDGNLGRAAVESWISFDFANRLFAAAGEDLGKLKAAASKRDFRPVALKAKANYQVQNTIREINSKNVVALLPGRDLKRRDEYVIYSSHWDHMGRDERLQGDQIFNGAADNASGSAVMLEIAQHFASLPESKRPARSLLFLAVTAEEKGLLGSRHYAENPLYPLTKTVANINMDGANHFAPTKDIEVIGWGASTIEEFAEASARSLGRSLFADTQPEKGFYFRSDHFEFAKVGVPAFYAKAGRIPIDKPQDYIDKRRAAYTANDYHKVSDQVTPEWDFTAMAQDAKFLMDLGERLANSTDWPQWREGSEFKAKRDAMMK